MIIQRACSNDRANVAVHTESVAKKLVVPTLLFSNSVIQMTEQVMQQIAMIRLQYQSHDAEDE